LSFSLVERLWARLFSISHYCFSQVVVGWTLTALTANKDSGKRWRRSTGVLVAVAVSELYFGVGWRCGVVEFRRLRMGGMWVLRTPRKLVRHGFIGETYLGYVGEGEADSLLGLTLSGFRWSWENFMNQTENQGKQRKRYWIKILKKSDAWKLLRNKTPTVLHELQKDDAYYSDGRVGFWTRSYYPLLKHLTLDLSLVDMENEESRRVFFTKVVPRMASKAEVPNKAAALAFGYVLKRFEGGYSPLAVRLFMPPLESIGTEDEFNRVALEVERKIVRVVGLQRWRVRNMWLYKNFLRWLKVNLNIRCEVRDMWDMLHGKYVLGEEDPHMRS